MKKIFFISFALLSLSFLQAKQTKHVVVAVVDGARYTETFGDAAHTIMPHLWNDLRPLGTLCTAFRNEGLTVTIPGHASVVTGIYQFLANDGSQRPTQPTIFEYFRKHYGSGDTSCWVALGKSKLDILSASTHPEFGSIYSAALKTSDDEYNDVIASDNIRWILQNYHPALAVVNFPQTDNRGHSGVWEDYLSALHQVDSLLALLWNTIQEDTILQGKTTLIITNDHGRHTYDFTSHGDGCEGCRHIMLLMIGPDTPSDVIDPQTREQVDIAPTIGALLDFPTPFAAGTILYPELGLKEPEHSPFTYQLYQNYPNPFNPGTTVSYRITAKSHVTLKVYDVIGREVATLVDAVQQPNLYEIPFEGKNLSSGVYFYALQFGNFRESKKMVLIK